MSQMKKKLRSAVSAVVRNRSFHIPRRVAEKDLLDIGCGFNVRDGFITLDFSWHRRLDICWDVTRGIPLPDECVSGVFSEHCLEHLPLPAGDALLGEILRVLKPGGRVRLIVPDAELYARRYIQAIDGVKGEPLPYADRDRLGTIYQPVMSVNRIFTEHGHRFIYDYHLLETLLRENGFEHVHRSSYGTSSDPRLLNDSERRAAESLYVEASAPL